MEKRNIVLNSSKTLLNETNKNDLFMELDILLLRDEPNLNNYHFTSSFIDEIVNNQDKYNALPIVVDLDKLLSNDYLNLGHNMSPFTGKFYSQQIGSYVSFNKVTGEDGVAELHGKARISKRNPDLISVLTNMYNSSLGLSFSVEVIASDYTIDQNNTLIIGASPNNYLLSDAIVSFPACPESQALKLVAEINNSLKGGEKLDKKDILSELSHDDIRVQLSELLNPNFDSNGYRIYDYWVVSVFDDYVITSDEHMAGIYYKFDYSIENDEVKLGEKSQVTIQFVSINQKGGQVNMEKVSVDVNELVKEKEALTLKNEEFKKQIDSLTAEKETLVSEKSDLEVKLNEANEAVVSLGKEKETLTSEVEELSKFKTETVERENTSKIEAIINEVKADLTEEELKLVNELAEDKDLEKVQYKINEICANKYKETIKLTNSQNEESFFAVNNQRDLGNDELSKFNM